MMDSEVEEEIFTTNENYYNDSWRIRKF